MCLSVLEKFSEYKSYNIQSLVKTEEEIKNEKNKLIKLNEQKKDKEEKGIALVKSDIIEDLTDKILPKGDK